MTSVLTDHFATEWECIGRIGESLSISASTTQYETIFYLVYKSFSSVFLSFLTYTQTTKGERTDIDALEIITLLFKLFSSLGYKTPAKLFFTSLSKYT